MSKHATEAEKKCGTKVGTLSTKSSRMAVFDHFPLDDGDPYGSRTAGNGPPPDCPLLGAKSRKLPLRNRRARMAASAPIADAKGASELACNRSFVQFGDRTQGASHASERTDEKRG